MLFIEEQMAEEYREEWLKAAINLMVYLWALNKGRLGLIFYYRLYSADLFHRLYGHASIGHGEQIEVAKAFLHA